MYGIALYVCDHVELTVLQNFVMVISINGNWRIGGADALRV